MAERPVPEQVTALERQILRRLVTGRIEPVESAEVESKLRSYAWRDADCAVIYQAILRIRARGMNNWREQLPVETTRMGFPDLDWSAFFEMSPKGAPGLGLEQLLHQLETNTDSGS